MQAWELNDPIQRAMKNANEKRYDLSTLRKSSKRTMQEEFAGDELVNSRDKKTRSSDTVQSVEVKVKVENPTYLSFKQQLGVLRTGKGDFIADF